jgi:hypothetical protein
MPKQLIYPSQNLYLFNCNHLFRIKVSHQKNFTEGAFTQTFLIFVFVKSSFDFLAIEF